MTTSALLLLLTLLPQSPDESNVIRGPGSLAGQAREASSGNQDEVILHSGEVLRGRILVERANYLEVEVAPGAKVGLRRSEVREVVHAAKAESVGAAAETISSRDEWFQLHDGAGRAVGWLHQTMTPGEGGGGRVLEEWEFQRDRRFYQITSIAELAADGAPAACYFRERISEELLGQADLAMARKTRIREERIVEAKVEGEVLAVTRLTAAGRSSRDIPWPEGASFPLLVRDEEDGAEIRHVVVFDPAVEEMQTRSFAAQRQRTVTIDGETRAVTESVETTFGIDNVTWRDLQGGVLRREVAGPGLVAVRSVAEAAQRAVRIGAQQPPMFLAESGHKMGMWLPNPSWEAQPVGAGSVSLRNEAHGASITATLLDHLGDSATLDTAATSVEKWLVLLDPKLVVDSRTYTRVRGRQAVRLAASPARSTTPAATRQRMLLVVVPHQDAFVVVRCAAPERVWDELAADFDVAIERIELDPRGVTHLVVDASQTPGGDGDRATGASRAQFPSSPSQPAQSRAVPAAKPAKGMPRVRIPRQSEQG